MGCHHIWAGWRDVQLLLYLSVACGIKCRKAQALLKASELSYTRRASALPLDIGVFKRQGDKVMHSDKNHVFLPAEQCLCHSSEKKALMTGRTQPTRCYTHEDTDVPASGPGTEAHTAGTQ